MSECKQEYNGWTNYETWAVTLWMSNDQGSSAHWEDQAWQVLSQGADKDEAACTLAHLIKQHHQEAQENALQGACEHSVFADLLEAAMSEVNWYEIAEHYLDID